MRWIVPKGKDKGDDADCAPVEAVGFEPQHGVVI